MSKQIFSRIRISAIVVLVASAIAVTSFFLPWTSLVLVLEGNAVEVLITNSGFEIARKGISDKHSSLSWVYFITPLMAFFCFVFGLLGLITSSRLHIAQIILAVFALLPFSLMVIEFNIVNQLPAWLDPFATVPRYGAWLAILGLISVIAGSLIDFRQRQ